VSLSNNVKIPLFDRYSCPLLTLHLWWFWSILGNVLSSQALSSSNEKYPIFTFVEGQGQDYGLEGHSSNHSGPAGLILPPGNLSRSNNRRNSDEFVLLWVAQEDAVLLLTCRGQKRTPHSLSKGKTWFCWCSCKVDMTLHRLRWSTEIKHCVASVLTLFVWMGTTS